MLIPRPFRIVALGVAIAGASGVAGLLEPVTGCLSLVLVVLFTHFFDRGCGRLAAGFASLGIAEAILSSARPLLSSGSISRCTVAIGAAWLCAELVSRRSQRDSAAQSKNDDLNPKVHQALAASEKEAKELLDRLPGRFATRTAEDFDFINQQILEASGTTKRRTRPMLGFKTFRCARIVLGGIELMHMIKKGQMKGTGQTAAEQFYSLAK